MKRNPFAAALAVMLILAPSLGMASEWKDGYTPSNGVAPGTAGVGVWDGATFRAARGDASGILRVTEEYPAVTATNTYTAATAVPMSNSALIQIGNGWTAYPYALRSVYVKRTCASGTSAAPCFPIPESYGYLGKYLALFGKRDGSIVQSFTVVWFGRQK